MPDVPIAAQIMEVERELSMRYRVYPNQVARGLMKKAQADLHIRQMEAVLETLQKLKAAHGGERSER